MILKSEFQVLKNTFWEDKNKKSMKERKNNHIKISKVFEQQNKLLLFVYNKNELICKRIL
jgi:hypothetical protein